MALTLPRASALRRHELKPRIPAFPSASWLLSPFPSRTWLVAGIGHQAPTSITFDIQLADGNWLSSVNPSLADTVKWVTFWLRTGPTASIRSGEVQATAASNLLTLCAWMHRNGIPRFCDLTPVDVEAYAATAAYGQGSILEVDDQLERFLEQLRSQASELVQSKQYENFFAAARALVPLSGKKRGETLDHVALLEQVGLKGLSCRSNIRASLRAFADEVGLRTSIKDEDEGEARPVSSEHLRRFLSSFEQLYQYRTLVDDSLEFNPFPGSSAGKYARARGAEIGRTQTVLPLQAMTFIERCVRWVVDYSEPLLAVQKLGNERASRFEDVLRRLTFEGPGAPRVVDKVNGWCLSADVSAAMTPITLDQALRLLATACATTVAAFSARRSFEIVSLRMGCMRKDSAGNYWLTTFIHKSLQRDAKVPVPAVVARAVEVLERLSEVARRLTGTPYLLQINATGTDECTWTAPGGFPCFPFAFYMDKLGRYLDVPPLEDGSHWDFKPHQTRRFFAIVYIWIYELGEFGALSAHLKHFNFAQTMRYVTEVEVGRIVRMVQRERTALILARATANPVAAQSPRAARFAQMADKLKSRLMLRMKVVPPRKYQQRLERLVDLAGISLSAAEFGFEGFAPDHPRAGGPSAELGAQHLRGTYSLHQQIASSRAAGSIRATSAAWLT